MSSVLPGSKTLKLEKIVESVQAATRPAPLRVAQSWMNAPQRISGRYSASGK